MSARSFDAFLKGWVCACWARVMFATIFVIVVVPSSSYSGGYQTPHSCDLEQNNENVEGLFKEPIPDSSPQLYRFVLLSCSSGDSFATAVSVYFNMRSDLGATLPRDCKLVVGEALTSEQIGEKRKELARVVGGKKIVDRLLDTRSGDEGIITIIYLLGISKASEKVIIRITKILNSLNILTRILSKGKIKKAFAVVDLAVVLVAVAIFLDHKMSKRAQDIIDRFFGRSNSSGSKDRYSFSLDCQIRKQQLKELSEELARAGARELELHNNEMY